jgi:uncharacterized membrane protein YhhN
VAHCLYIAACLQTTRRLLYRRGLPLLSIGFAIFVFLKPFLPAELKAPVFAYVLVIALMCWRSVCRIGSANATILSAALGTVGSIVFMVSDTCIAVDKFFRPIPHCKLIVMLTYYAAQILIASSTLTDDDDDDDNNSKEAQAVAAAPTQDAKKKE